MSWSDVGTIFQKDWLQTLRDRNTLIIMLVGVLALPVMTTVSATLLQKRMESGTRTRAQLLIVGEDAEWVANQLPRRNDLKVLFESRSNDLDRDLRAATSQGALVLTIPNNMRHEIESSSNSVPELKLYIDNRRDNLNERVIVDGALDKWRTEIVKSRMGTSSLPSEIGADLKIKIRSLASNSDRTGATFGLMLPIELTLVIVLLSLYSATELVTAERERGTLVLLAVAPPARRDILTAKTLVVIATVALGTLLAIVAQFALLIAFVPNGADLAGSYPLTIPFPAALFVLPIALPLIALISAVAIALASYVRNFQQAQSYASLVLILSMLPACASLLPTADFPPIIAVLPIANTALAIRDALSGQLTAQFAAAVLISTCVYAALSVALATRLLDSEHAVFPQDEPAGAWRVNARLLATFLTGVFLAYFVLGQTVQSIDVLFGLIGSQVLIIGAPGVLFLFWLRLPVAKILSLRKPTSWLSLPAAGLLAPGTILFACGIMALQDLVLPAPKALEEMLNQVLLPAGKPVWLTFVAVAAAPAICEELLFRGVVQGILIRSLPPKVVLPITALGFGLFHMSAFRLLPTGSLGLVLCFLTFRYKSIYPAMILHFCHNAIGVAITVYHINPFTPQNMILAVVSTALGIAVLSRRS